MEKRRFRWFFPGLSAALLVLFAVTVFMLIKVREREMALGDKVTELEEELAEVPTTEEVMAAAEGTELENGEIYYSRETIKLKARDANSLTELMAMIFSDRAVYYDGEKYIYAPLAEGVALNDYELDKIITDEDTGLKSYTDSKGRTALMGIDVSTWQGDIDWARVKAAGVQFAFLRAGLRGYESGTVFEDDTVRYNLREANANGIPVGIYFYTQAATPEEGREEARMVLDLIRGYEVTWPIVFDVELEGSETSRTRNLTPAQRTDIAIAFCETIEQAGYRPMIYGNMRMLCGELETGRLAAYDMWLAQYFNRPRCPYRYGIWQYTSTGRIDGISGDVDIDMAFVDYGA